MKAALNREESASTTANSNMPMRPLIRNPASLSSLPGEIIAVIASHLPQSAALSLALTSRAFVSPAESQIWKSLNLVLHPHFGELPLVQPHARTEDWDYECDYKKWAGAERGRAETRYSAGLKEMIKGIIMRAGARRTRLVEGVRIDPRPGMLYGLLHVLDAVSPQLKTMDIQAKDRHIYYESERRPNPDPCPVPFHETLDCKLIDAGLFFPALTHVRIGRFAMYYTDFVLLLCRSAPNLAVLDVCYQHYYVLSDETSPPFPLTVFPDTKLDSLHLAFNSPDLDDESYDEDKTAGPLLEIMEASPVLRRFSLDYHGCSESIIGPLCRFLYHHKNLQDLHWQVDAAHLSMLCVDDEPISRARRLVLSPHSWTDTFCLPSNMPNLEILGIVKYPYHTKYRSTDPSAYPQTISACAMIPSFADGLRRLPRLSIIHTLDHSDESDLYTFDRLDEVEASGKSSGWVRSLCHGESELLHASLLLSHAEISDEICQRRSGSCGQWEVPNFVYYDARDGTKRQKTYSRLDEPRWTHYTDFDDLVVPLAIIDTMREVTGATEDEWQGRRIEVGDKAWKVLTDWREVQERCGR